MARKFVSKNRRPSKGNNPFWEREYTNPEHFSLSDKPGSELVKFVRWLRKDRGDDVFAHMNILDVGCGNGRNLIYVADQFGVAGQGFDIAQSAVDRANKVAQQKHLQRIKFFRHTLGDEPLPVADASVDVVFDMMVSHCLRESQRIAYRAELVRVLKPGGMVLIKTFLKEGDQHATRMIRDNPGGEYNAYIHPKIGIYEYVWTEQLFRDFWGQDFVIHLLHKSHGYQRWGGVPYKRRYMVAFLEKPRDY